ncbi:MAG: DEAD/DEAH box helicase [Verrucomicrobia bacterium]|nr:DEAD/DEAH box helicase [Verrucomicrobiota bacterium]
MRRASDSRTRGRRSLADHLSHLSVPVAERLLGPEGRRMLLLSRGQPGRFEGGLRGRKALFVDCAETEGTPGVRVEIRLDEGRRGGLRLRCLDCGSGPCLHQAGALAFVLERKVALGLAAAPIAKVPVEWLDEPGLVDMALAQRRAKALAEPMQVTALDGSTPWTDYTVTNRNSGHSYRVALRGWEGGQSYCSCPDFRKNTLALCKHTLRVISWAKRKFPAKIRRTPWRPDRFALSLTYGETLKLKLEGPPESAPPSLAPTLLPILGKAWERPGEVAEVVNIARRLAASGTEVIVYPDAEAYISRTLDREWFVRRMEALRHHSGDHPLRNDLLRVPLLPYQLEGIAFAAVAGRSILADEMGLGKTIQAIGLAELLAREGEVSRVLVVCPASLKAQWASEIGRFSHRNCHLVLGNGPSRAEQYRHETFFTVCNYEQVTRDRGTVERERWDLIILDEGQRIKNWEAKTSRAIKSLPSPYALVLSGTPLENRLDELFSIMEFIDDRRLGPAFRFYNRYRVVDEKGKVAGYRNLGELRERLRPCLLRRTRAALLRDLPARTTEIVRVRPTEEQAEISSEQLRIVSSITRKKQLNELDLCRLRGALLTARLAADSTFLIHRQAPGHSSKLQRLKELLTDLALEEDRKIIIFSEWTTMLDLIEPLLHPLGLEHVRLQGSVPQKDRQALVSRFQTVPACRVFLTTNAGSVGLNLQAANTIINVDLPWNPAILEQRIARAHRMGQKRPVQVFLLVTEGTIEENLLHTLGAKHELARAALDLDAELDSVELSSGMEELKRRLEILLGKPPEPTPDVTAPAPMESPARLLRPPSNKSEAVGGDRLGLLFAALAEILPQPTADSPALQVVARRIRATLDECLTSENDGRVRLSFTLADHATVDRLAEILSRCSAPQAGGGGIILAD